MPERMPVMVDKMRPSLRRARELVWLAPFVCIGLLVLASVRPPPVFPAPGLSRIVTDADGVPVAIPVPVHAVAGGDFLELTHAPSALIEAGNRRERSIFAGSIMSHLYRAVLRDDSLWNAGDDGTLEALLARDRGFVYPSFGGNAVGLRRFGLAALAMSNHARTRDQYIYRVTRHANAILGQDELARNLVDGYAQTYRDLHRDLQPETLTARPKVLTLASRVSDWTFLSVWESNPFDEEYRRAGVENAADSHINVGRYQDAERILAMNPDTIVVYADTPQDFLHDRRWRGLKAVQDRRVYQGLRELRASREPLHLLDLRPAWARWLAELAHPERLQPKLRAMLRDHYEEAYGYRLSDDEIDNLLRVDENKDEPGYARFLKNDPAAAGHGVAP